ncbi:unnamed protein product [Hymenolepis diminuta]|nr:unnamed protein product [Hymenolepis diminuta]
MDDMQDDYLNHSDSEDFSDGIEDEFNRVNDDVNKDVIVKPHIKVFTPEMLIRYMLENVKSVEQITLLPKTINRLLLDYFKWSQDDLTDRYFEAPDSLAFLRKTILPTLDPSYTELPSLKLRSYSEIHSSKDPSVREIACDICCDSCPPDQIFALGCDHFYCRNCWTRYLESKILNNNQANKLTCPTPKCECLIDDDCVADLLSSSCEPSTSSSPNSQISVVDYTSSNPTSNQSRAFRAFQRLVVNSFVQHHRHLTWCPGVDCGYAVCSNEEYGTMGPEGKMLEVICSNCKEIFCFNCGNPWHEPVLCKYLKLWLTKMKNDSGTAHWVAANTKECPKCKATIEKNGGCNHMTCRNADCKYEFCWVCLGGWDAHGAQWYVCNSYKEAAARKAREAQDKNREALSRYLFFYDRYANHDQSRKLEATLKDSVANRMQELEDQGFNWIDVKFIRHVVEVLCACRRTLMYTYVFAYFLKPSNEALIFEANQSDLERAAENLSRILENELNGVIAAQDLTKKLQDTSRYCSSRREVLLQHVKEGYQNGKWQHRDNLYSFSI